MAASESFLEFLRDLMAPLGPIVARRMFSGAGLFTDGLMFALVIDDTLHFKVDDSNRAAFEAEGMKPFVYQAKGRSVALGYWRVPERLLDEPEELAAWSRAAMAVARRAASAKVRKAKGGGKKPAARSPAPAARGGSRRQ